ncbi:MAG: hypothetical protein QE485_16995 [Acidovorax sp.]|uniref:hypothetical protein n=1 Tax=Acidovorax sp. TaxID=1872122 RepID=UPI0026048E7B|nr:hypothetical protein [Acidovorax sp.]MDH4418909.1 hypothetical protein [Acidovorax sp.]
MSYPLINGAEINGTDSDGVQTEGIELVTAGVPALALALDAGGAQPLELGDHVFQIGFNAAPSPAGLDLVHTGLHSVFMGQPGADVTLFAPGARVLELGGLAVDAGGITVDAGSAQPLELGGPGFGVAGLASGAHVLELGEADAGFIAEASDAVALEFGLSVVRFRLAPNGIELGRSGTHTLVASGVLVETDGVHALELGDPGQPRFTAFSRQAFPLEMGHHAASRGSAC